MMDAAREIFYLGEGVEGSSGAGGEGENQEGGGSRSEGGGGGESMYCGSRMTHCCIRAGGRCFIIQKKI